MFKLNLIILILQALIVNPINCELNSDRKIDFENDNKLTDDFKNFIKFSGMSLYDFQVDKEDGYLTSIQLIEKYGYRSEVHTVETEDGYLLDLHRINGRKDEPIITNKPVVFLMHGLLCSSSDWILIGPNNSLAYMLVDNGYDVWLGNARGNRYSRKHKNWDPKMYKFWQFSWHEIGFYDLPAKIDYILSKTKQEKLNYIGHSQGTTAFFVMTSTKPEYNSKIQLMQALAPVAYLSNMNSPLLKVVTSLLDSISLIIDAFGVNEFLPNSKFLKFVADIFCTSSAHNNLCLNVLFQLSGADPDQVDLSVIPVLIGHTPAGASSKQLIHFGQSVRSGEFRRYDHGKLKNLAMYGVPEPPKYNLTQISAPIFFHYGLNDYLAHPKDVLKLYAELSSTVGINQLEHKLFNHLDFLLAKDIKIMLYQQIVDNIVKYSSKLSTTSNYILQYYLQFVDTTLF
uniref:Putative triglyceride lipase-cholesterol esterase n=1 Tax=Corethrella appendiculata TaxID=1370023 RepID=U5ERJ2_9DIPT